MQILLDITQDREGRLSGSARLTSHHADAPPVAFSGTLELLASVEDLCRRSSPTATRRPDHAAPVKPRPPSDTSDPAVITAKDPS